MKELINNLCELAGAILALILKAAIFAVIFWQMAIWFNVVPHTVECGMCGANVYETWSVRTMDDSGFATVCEKCYDDCREND